MRRLKTVLTLLLLALWLPASSHGFLEGIGWIHTEHLDQADASDADNDHDAADGKCVVVSNPVQVPQPELTGSPLPFPSFGFSLIVATLLHASLAAPNGPDPPGVAPPEFTHTWQFSFRASLPPRAPSLIS